MPGETSAFAAFEMRGGGTACIAPAATVRHSYGARIRVTRRFRASQVADRGQTLPSSGLVTLSFTTN